MLKTDNLEYMHFIYHVSPHAMSNICSHAAYNGAIKCLIYAHEKGYPWNARVCSNAALKGHLDCLVYAHQHGCPWDAKTIMSAPFATIINGNYPCLQYALQNGCPTTIL